MRYVAVGMRRRGPAAAARWHYFAYGRNEGRVYDASLANRLGSAAADTLTGAYLGGRKQIGMGFRRFVAPDRDALADRYVTGETAGGAHDATTGVRA